MKNRNILQSFACAFSGMAHILRREKNMKIHFGAAISVVIFAMIIGVGMEDILWIFLAIALVLISEVLNTFFEELLNLVSPDYSRTVKYMKDIAAGAVLTASVFSIIVAIMVFGKRFGSDQSLTAVIVLFVYFILIFLISSFGGEKSEKDKSGNNR